MVYCLKCERELGIERNAVEIERTVITGTTPGGELTSLTVTPRRCVNCGEPIAEPE
jgi:hypothetical protein